MRMVNTRYATSQSDADTASRIAWDQSGSRPRLDSHHERLKKLIPPITERIPSYKLGGTGQYVMFGTHALYITNTDDD
jgi:hypothetical protein